MPRLILLLLTAALGGSSVACADPCHVIAAHQPDEAEKAYLAADYAQAADLYRKALADKPNDPALIAGLARTLERQQKSEEAVKVVSDALAAHPVPALLVTEAEAEYYDGRPWDAERTALAAQKDNLCNPRLHLLLASIADITSNFATGYKQLQFAHQLDPHDPEIRGLWIDTLPQAERIAELEKYLDEPVGLDADEVTRMRQSLEDMKKQAKEPVKACRLVSNTQQTQMYFSLLTVDYTRASTFGLHVKLNKHNANLEIDTGSSGLLVSRSIAARAGIKPFSEVDVNGIGDKKSSTGYRGYADTIHIGDLEFHDCSVTVVDNDRLDDVDGLIGMDVFSDFLVTLDYPKRKLHLDPLPKRPDEAADAAPSLSTSSDPASNTAPKAGDETGKQSAAGKPAAGQIPRGLHDQYVPPELKDYSAVYRMDHDLMLPVALNESKLKLFILDTGSWATNISPEAAREVTKVRSNEFANVRGINGQVEKVYEADQVIFSFAHVSQKILHVPSFDTTSVSKSVGLKISGFLGARTLRLTTIHIDYRDGLVKFDYDPKRLPG